MPCYRHQINWLEDRVPSSKFKWASDNMKRSQANNRTNSPNNKELNANKI